MRTPSEWSDGAMDCARWSPRASGVAPWPSSRIATGGSLSYTWNLSSVAAGTHIIKVYATDAAGNKSSFGQYVSK